MLISWLANYGNISNKLVTCVSEGIISISVDDLVNGQPLHQFKYWQKHIVIQLLQRMSSPLNRPPGAWPP